MAGGGRRRAPPEPAGWWREAVASGSGGLGKRSDGKKALSKKTHGGPFVTNLILRTK